jgi:hypothetical protein
MFFIFAPLGEKKYFHVRLFPVVFPSVRFFSVSSTFLVQVPGSGTQQQ